MFLGQPSLPQAHLPSGTREWGSCLLGFEAQVSWRHICNEGMQASQANLIKTLDYNPFGDQPCRPRVISPEL